MSKQSLLDRELNSDHGILRHPDHKFIRITFVIVSQTLLFVLGSGFYAIPMFLNFILPDHVHLTRQALTLLGSAPFIGLLGASGAVILWINSLKFDKTTEFLIMTAVGSVCTALAWILLYVLVQDTPEDQNDQNISLICFALILFGSAVGFYFTTWQGKLLPLIKPEFHFVFNTCCNLSFAGGSIVSLCLKLVISMETWITLMTIVQVAAVIISFVFVCAFRESILIPPEDSPVTEVSTKQLIIEFLLWKRQYSKDILATKDCQVTSRQFWWMLLSFTSSCALATTFMANLGPLVSANSSTSDNFRWALIVLIWASVGQTLARMMIPIVARQIGSYMKKSIHQWTERDEEIVQLRINSKLTLYSTFLVGLVFFVFLLVLRLSDIPFIYASTVVSGAYGAVWVINNFALFFPGYNYCVILSFFQFFGMLGMIICNVIISALKLDNDGVFVLLLIVSIITMIFTAGTAIDRATTEQSVISAFFVPDFDFD